MVAGSLGKVCRRVLSARVPTRLSLFNPSNLETRWEADTRVQRVNKQLGFLAALIAGVCLLVTCSSRSLSPPTGVEDSVVIVIATVEIEEKVSPFHFLFPRAKGTCLRRHEDHRQQHPSGHSDAYTNSITYLPFLLLSCLLFPDLG